MTAHDIQSGQAGDMAVVAGRKIWVEQYRGVRRQLWDMQRSSTAFAHIAEAKARYQVLGQTLSCPHGKKHVPQEK
jgi:hypothetical protein